MTDQPWTENDTWMLRDGAKFAGTLTESPLLAGYCRRAADEIERLQTELDWQLKRTLDDLLFLQPARDAEEWGAHLTTVAAKRIRELEAALAAEREACAMIADDRAVLESLREDSIEAEWAAREIAAAIRARGETV